MSIKDWDLRVLRAPFFDVDDGEGRTISLTFVGTRALLTSPLIQTARTR